MSVCVFVRCVLSTKIAFTISNEETGENGRFKNNFKNKHRGKMMLKYRLRD